MPAALLIIKTFPSNRLYRIVTQESTDNDGAGGRWQISTAGGLSPRWAPDGRELYYIALDQTLTSVAITVRGGAVEAGRPAALFSTRLFQTAAAPGTQYDVSHDGRFLVSTRTADSISPITLLQNWKPE